MPQGFVVWLTGLSGAGKTTIAAGVAQRLRLVGLPVEVLDGDVIRRHLSHGLGFSKEDRDTNIRRIAFVAKLLARNGVAVVVAAISPYREIRDEARAELDRFVEVYVKCSLEELIRRDTKGLYTRALRGELPNVTGVSALYEEPLAPEVTVETDREPAALSVENVLCGLERLGYAWVNTCPDPLISAGRLTRYESIPPHGWQLVNRLAAPDEAAFWRSEAKNLPALTLNSRQISDVEMIAIGGFSPLTGFLRERDYDSVLRTMRLVSGLVWPIPVTLAVTPEEAGPLRISQPVVLRDAAGQFMAILQLEEKFVADVDREARCVYRTTDLAHPGVRALYRQGPVLLAGSVTLIQRPSTPFPPYRLDPRDTRVLFATKGWRRVVGCQTQTPIHRAHEYIQKAALETVDGLFLHPIIGETDSDDIPADVRMRCYEALLASYYPNDRVELAINPAAMRSAGPRAAVFHALVLQNYGCTHCIVERDHAGVGNYYGTYDAHHVFGEFEPDEIAITPLFFEHTFYCQVCSGVVSIKTCPHDTSHHVALSGTQVRDLVRAGQPIPTEFTRPEVATILSAVMHGDSVPVAAS